ncbi:cytochrome P450 [Actinocorallia populi]|uniref:cytochrome P450 n=1 Tax=Actinocorallia populi TaxID=2079200 RepID=UPI0013004942|nr:cytochrome P450 [Actinocorallia populi]
MTDPALYDDPWDFYAWLRREQPVRYDKDNDLYVLSRHADVVTASRDNEHFSAAQGVRPINMVPLSIVAMDDPEHSRQRRLLSRGFTPRQVRQLTDHVRELTNDVIDKVETSGEIDFVADLARHVPLIVIAELLGLDRDLCDKLYEWSDAMMSGEGQSDFESPVLLRATEAFVEYTTVVSEAVQQRRQQTEPGTDLLSLLTAAFDEGKLDHSEELRTQLNETTGMEELSDQELLMFCVLLMVAGNETTRNAIAGGLRAFTLFPEQRELLRTNPELIDSAVDEIVRWTSPVLNFLRTVTAPITLSGVDLKPGDRVLLLYQSANRDEEAFDKPDEFRIDRSPNPHVGFGIGTHYCMGANLARMEIKVVFEELFRRLPDIEVSDPDALPKRNPSAFVAAIQSMPARFTPVQGGSGGCPVAH